MTRYFGKVCEKHPELNGERLKSNSSCIRCHNDRRALRRANAAVAEHERKKALQWYYNKCNTGNYREIRNERLRKRRKEDPAYRQECNNRLRMYYESNRGKFKSYRVARKDGEAQRTPRWANANEIEKVYLAAKGAGMTVDHYYPLFGKTVSGLHVAANLRVIPQSENDSKGNKHPDEFYGEVK